jgi:hypothetical protein
MHHRPTAGIAPVPGLAAAGPHPSRALLAVLTALAVLGGGAVLMKSPAATLDPDLVRVIRFMAVIKGVFALAALVGSFWRLARPAAPWRTSIYVAGPPLMAVGAIGLWSLHDPGLAALSLHVGLFALLGTALTDPQALPDLPRRRRGRR